ncbi:MAG TPA: outer membrane beta-barrel protein [Cryomorphaceae bacterium]|nr:outer membrane beta-barrel protein [Cryomorphaceae bacterium]
MKKLPFLLLALVLVFGVTAQAQESSTLYKPGKGYISFEGEMIFSLADIEAPEGSDIEQNLRWSPVFNLAWHYNYDVNSHFGLNAGVGFRNVGFIVKGDAIDPENIEIDRKKYRTYNLGIPLGFKVGRLDQGKPLFLFAGYEFEFPFHYKEKQFDGGDKLRKRTDWFSDRTADLQQAVFVGIQLPEGFSLKAKYYLTDFFDPDFSETLSLGDASENVLVKPYENFNAQVFYLSITWFPFQDLEYTLHKTGYEQRD